jgi:hypothetical protein
MTLLDILGSLLVFAVLVALAIFGSHKAVEASGLPPWAAYVFSGCFISCVVGYGGTKTGNVWGLMLGLVLPMLPVFFLPHLNDGSAPETLALVGMLMGYASLVVVPVLAAFFVAVMLWAEVKPRTQGRRSGGEHGAA